MAFPPSALCRRSSCAPTFQAVPSPGISCGYVWRGTFYSTPRNRIAAAGWGGEGAVHARLVKGPRRGREAGWWWGSRRDGASDRKEWPARRCRRGSEGGSHSATGKSCGAAARAGARRRAQAGSAGSSSLLPPAVFPPSRAGAGFAPLFSRISCCLYKPVVTPSSRYGVSLSRLQAELRQPSALHRTSRLAAARRGGTWCFPPRPGLVAPRAGWGNTSACPGSGARPAGESGSKGLSQVGASGSTEAIEVRVRLPCAAAASSHDRCYFVTLVFLVRFVWAEWKRPVLWLTSV